MAGCRELHTAAGVCGGECHGGTCDACIRTGAVCQARTLQIYKCMHVCMYHHHFRNCKGFFHAGVYCQVCVRIMCACLPHAQVKPRSAFDAYFSNMR